MDADKIHHFSEFKRDGEARAGVFTTAHGPFTTPNFMPVGTRGSVKGIDSERLEQCGAEIMLVNTYHLWLRPGSEVVRKLGGIHQFCSWEKPILSDSGGYQIFSLKHLRKLSEEGVEFRSHIDGALCFLTPEKAVAIQEELGVDIAMVLDECPSSKMSDAELERSLALTLRWAGRCLKARREGNTALFAITQGGLNRSLRTRAAEELCALDFQGFAIGGLSVGEGKEFTHEVLSYHVRQLPSDKLRYLMGVGTPEDIVQGVSKGVDLFDCVMPTRAGRFGRAFVDDEVPYINIRNAQFAEERDPLDYNCKCLCCSRYSRGYLHHLFKVGEMLGPQLLSLHNLFYYLGFMKRIRRSIEDGDFEKLHIETKRRWQKVGIEELSEEETSPQTSG